MDKLVFNDSFDYGIDMPLVTIADDPKVLSKCASEVTDEWGTIDPIKGHTLIHIIALGGYEKTGCNRNSDAWTEKVLQEKHATFKSHGSLYRNHKAEDDLKEGFVHKTAYNKPMGRVELVVAADNNKCADWLSDIESGKPTSFSMGFKCTHPGDECSICGNFAKTREEYCSDLNRKTASAGRGLGKIIDDGRKCFVYNDAGFFNDISKVPVGADAIAMDLRKVASLDGSTVIGGAELAEQYFINRSDVNYAKVAMARKLADIEKRIEAIGTGMKTSKKRVMKKVACDMLRSVPVAEMFYELTKLSAILPIENFYQVIFGDDFSQYEKAVNKCAMFESGMFSNLVNDQERLIEVCSNTTYDPASFSHIKMDYSTKRAIAEDYSINSDLAVGRALDRVSSAEEVVNIKHSSLQDDYLLNQYSAYKLSALLSINPSADESILFSALI